jgi:hypothetical protein
MKRSIVAILSAGLVSLQLGVTAARGAGDTIQSPSGQFTIAASADPKSGRSKITAWQTDRPSERVDLGDLDSFNPDVVHFSPEENHLVLQDRLSSGFFLQLFRVQTDSRKDGSQSKKFVRTDEALGSVIQQSAYCSAGLTNTGIGVDRDNVWFGSWIDDSHLKFRYSARLDQKNLEGNFGYSIADYEGIVDVAAVLVTGVTRPARTDWNKDLPDKLLNQVYNELKQTLSPAEKDKLAAEQKEWLAKRDAIQDLEEQNRFVLDRARELLGRTRTK